MILVQLDSEQLESLIERSVCRALEKMPTQEPEPEPDTYLTIEEAAPILRLTVPTIYRKVSQRLIPGVCKRGNRLFFSKKALLEYIQQGRRKTRAEIIDTAETYLAINK
jgi:excisionase family DNA binding protein